MRQSLTTFLCLGVALALVGCQQQDDEPDLASTEQLAIATPTPTVTFPSTQVGQTSAPITIQINPTAYTYNQISAISFSCPDYLVNAVLPGEAYRTCEPVSCIERECPIPRANALPPCGPGSETMPYYFEARFRPTVAAATSCQLTVVGSSNTIYINLTGTGTVPPVAADTVPTSVNFGDVRRGTSSAPATVTLRNTGGQNLNVSSITTSGTFSYPGATAFTLGPGATQGLPVHCNPTATGATGGTLTINSNFTQINVPLACTGIDSALDISPSPLTLPTARVGEPQSATITIANSGTAAMSLASVTFAGTGINLVAAPGAMTLEPGQSAMARIEFPADTVGDASGMLTVMYDGGQARTSAVSARAVNTSMSMSPNGTIDLGPVCMGSTARKSFEIIANEQGPFTIESVSMPEGPFVVAATSLPAAVAGAGASKYQFEVSASPTAAGIQTAELSVETDIPGADAQTTQVVVEGLAGGVNGTPAELDLGGVPVLSNTVGQRIYVTNCSEAAVTLGGSRIVGEDSQEFSIVEAPQQLTLAPSQTVTYLVIASPKSVGSKAAVFEVEHPDGTITVNLLGDGLGEQVDEDTGRPSYYACAVGGSAAAAWPLLLALVFVRRRKR